MTATSDERPTSRALSGFEAVLAMVHTFLGAEGSTTVEISTGTTKHDNQGCVLVSLCGTTTAMRAQEAMILADVMEHAMNAFPDDLNAQALPNMIMGLRYAAQRIEKRNGEGQGKPS